MSIQRVSPELDRLLDPEQEVEELSSGYQLAEGPIWYQEGSYLLFNDVRGDRRMKWTSEEGVTEFHKPTNEANGLTRDTHGRLIACEHASRRVTRLEPAGDVTVVANRYKGARLNRPNDVVVKSDGSIYFTDPNRGVPPEELEMDCSGVYRLSADLGTMTLLVGDFIYPNGLAFSPDEKVLYVVETWGRRLRAFGVNDLGLLDLETARVLQTFESDLSGVPDGIKVDVEGNLYCVGPGGVWVLDPSGKHLGTIVTGGQTTNCGWGGDDRKTLFITTPRSLFRIHTKTPGVNLPTAPSSTSA